ncbi:MAG: DUF3800 domain-containing protein [Bifidobacterium pseudolongum]|nr:DUF3800 domain-containing protein [Bifidobacterium pseudolongum]
MTEYNLYCDESCHLEHDKSDVMVLGALIIPKEKTEEIRNRIIEIKSRYGVKARTEVKWTKASVAKLDLYKDLINYFFDDDDMRFRVLVAHKTGLNHAAFSQSHNDWYYKMYFTMLNRMFDSHNCYYVYIDVKDTHSAQRAKKLEDVCANSHYDFNHECIRRIQPIRSDEVQMMQITDLINGAVCRANRRAIEHAHGAKGEIIDLIRHRSGLSLTQSTTLGARKLNLFIWGGQS